MDLEENEGNGLNEKISLITNCLSVCIVITNYVDSDVVSANNMDYTAFIVTIVIFNCNDGDLFDSVMEKMVKPFLHHIDQL